MKSSLNILKGGLLICPSFQGEWIVATDLMATQISQTVRPVRWSDAGCLDNVMVGLKETEIKATVTGEILFTDEPPRLLQDASVLELMDEVDRKLRTRDALP